MDTKCCILLLSLYLQRYISFLESPSLLEISLNKCSGVNYIFCSNFHVGGRFARVYSRKDIGLNGSDAEN